jgi:plasmid maintenance system antidote protein VapI
MSEKERFRRVIVRVVIEAMETAGVDRSELARRMRVNRARTTQLLRGDNNFEIDTLARIADALDLECEFKLRPKRQAVLRSKRP